ncbi:hypothetical protein EDC30_104263 [Paucimonas lemoignei]|uniref:KOW domain-containing protein n=1 Tax=Paucimonas lemoignei TaxID=29443 RepID=A0A4R3I0V6_PAULE|nr:hypothetical protein [Paucimonas lemoignei]TCS37459.1 hypothetical protein EDC30_104263 [Paucimonas lemoignei]
MITTTITPGARVSFDSDHGPQRGVVAQIRKDLIIGQQVALVQVKGTQGGMPWKMPVEKLTLEAAQC